MQRAFATAAILVLCCAACATVGKAPTDPRLAEAQKAFDEGQKLKEEGQFAEAEPLAERALHLREAALGGAHPDVASCLNLLGVVLLLQSDFARAEPLLQRALETREAAFGKVHPDVAESLHSLANLYKDQGHYARAEPLFERAVEIREATLGENHPDVAKSLHNLAYVSYLQGHYARAESLYKRAIEIWTRVFGENHPYLADSVQSLATLYWSEGYDARAEPLFERARGIWEVTLGKEYFKVSYSLLSLARLYADQGQYARAEPLLQRALEIREAAFGKEHPDVAESLENLARFYADQGQYARAEPLLQRALAIGESLLGEEHPEICGSLNSLANVYMSQGQYARAEPLLQRALKIQEAALGKEHPEVAASLANLAELYSRQGYYTRAEPLYERALAIDDAAHPKNQFDLAQSLNNLARLRLAQQRLTESLPLFERALSASEEHLRQEVFGFSEARLASVLRLLRADEERLYALVRAHPDDARVRHLALTAALLRKGRSAEELANTSRIIYRGLGQADREAFERLRALRTQLSSLSLAGPGQLAPEDYQQRLKDLTDQGDALEADLARRSEPLRALHSPPPPSELLDRVAATLPQDGALVEFISYDDRPLVPTPGAPSSPSSGELRYLALLLFADGRTHALDLGPAAPIDAAVVRLHDALARRAVAYQPAAQELYNLAFRPLLSHLGKAQHLFLAPDGQLALTPFAALHDGRRFLVDAWDITYLTSGKDLLRRPQDGPPARSVVVLAAPEFNSPPATSSLVAQATPAKRSASLERFFSTLRSDVANQPWLALPGTLKEAEIIQRLLPQAQLLLGPAATKDALLKLEAPGVLHIATHGFFLEDSPAAKATRTVVQPNLLDSGPAQRPADPLLRSGLVLAGAHAPGAQPSSHREDSLVTALELAGMDLWGTQLVVLSACDTGRGDVKLGQGVYGLRRALVVAGAETVVTSLWKVDDETTHELMEGYYRKLLAGQGRASALREAMRALRQKRPHPYYWAPFIAIGRDTPLQGLVPFIEARLPPQ